MECLANPFSLFLIVHTFFFQKKHQFESTTIFNVKEFAKQTTLTRFLRVHPPQP